MVAKDLKVRSDAPYQGYLWCLATRVDAKGLDKAAAVKSD